MDPLQRDARVVWESLLFVKRTWPHAPRSIEDRDQGFERTFREHFWRQLQPELISSAHDLSFAAGLSTLSGLAHELDLLARWENQEWVFELKNGGGSNINKEMLMVFHEKVLDFYLANYGFLSGLRIMRGFLTGARYIEDGLRAYCAAWGIVLIDNELLPMPALPALLAEQKTRAGLGKLPGIEEDDIQEAEEQAQELVDYACRPLGDVIELSDLRGQLTIRLDRMTGAIPAAQLVERHRALCQQIKEWNALSTKGGQ